MGDFEEAMHFNQSTGIATAATVALCLLLAVVQVSHLKVAYSDVPLLNRWRAEFANFRSMTVVVFSSKLTKKLSRM